MKTLSEKYLIVRGLKISYLIAEPNNSSKNTPTILSLHGAGSADKFRTNYMLDPLIHTGIRFIAMDFSGHGKSEGSIALSSIAHRVLEALTLIEKVGDYDNLSLMGSSMGAHIALEIMRELGGERISNLLLFCPALYTADAFNLPFGNGFTELIRKPNSYLKADAHKVLKTFGGGFLLVQGKMDKIIPQDVTSMYLKSSTNASPSHVMMIDNCDHLVHKFLKENPPVSFKVLNVISAMVNCVNY